MSASLVVTGVCGFAMQTASSHGGTTSMSGVVLLALYLSFDSFQSQWQSALFRQEGVGQLEMMRGVNAFGSILSLIALLQNGELVNTSVFVWRHPACIRHLAMLALTGTFGQLFIYYTIRRFGAVTFSMLMASRQMFSLAISAALFGHKISFSSMPFVCLVFVAMALRIRRQMVKQLDAQLKGS